MPGRLSEAKWRAILSGEDPDLHRLRMVMDHIPTAPRCKLCHAPYGGLGRILLGRWFGPWEKNPQLCKNCMAGLLRDGPSGAEIELSLLFADVRGSTSIGERLRPAEFSALLGRFYRLAADAIVERDGVVDKFVGDEAIGLFIPAFTGASHAARAIGAARAILEAVGASDASPGGPIPVGAGVHSGIAYVGTLGASDDISLFTALGDVVNTTARLASLAMSGELLVSVEAAERATIDLTGLERRTVEVRGREAALDVFSVLVPAGSPRPVAAPASG